MNSSSAADIRARLKGAGFRWTPSALCWQAFFNSRTCATAAAIAGVPSPTGGGTQAA